MLYGEYIGKGGGHKRERVERRGEAAVNRRPGTSIFAHNVGGEKKYSREKKT